MKTIPPFKPGDRVMLNRSYAPNDRLVVPASPSGFAYDTIYTVLSDEGSVSGSMAVRLVGRDGDVERDRERFTLVAIDRVQVAFDAYTLAQATLTASDIVLEAAKVAQEAASTARTKADDARRAAYDEATLTKIALREMLD